MHATVEGKAREAATLKTSRKGHVYTQVALLVPNGRDLLGYPALKVVRLVAFEDLARKLAKTLRKGDTVEAEGVVKFERWNDKEGYQRTCLTVIAAKVERIGADPKPAKIPTLFSDRRMNISERMLAAAGQGNRTTSANNTKANNVSLAENC
jgi:single-stranded DNA-binding protein